MTSRLEPLYTVEDLADRYKLSPYTVRKWVNQRKFKGAKRIGGEIRIPLSAVEAFEQQAPEY